MKLTKLLCVFVFLISLFISCTDQEQNEMEELYGPEKIVAGGGDNPPPPPPPDPPSGD